MLVRRYLYPPVINLEESNRQLHGGDLIEYFIDSLAIACRNRVIRRDCKMIHPNA